MKPTIYFIPGFGGDYRMFAKQQENLPYPSKVIEWLVPDVPETMEDYAWRLSREIDTSKPFVLVGVSMGGVFSIELRRFLPVKPHTHIIISSIKRTTEKPAHVKALYKLPIYQAISPNSFRFFKLFSKQAITVLYKKEHVELFNSMVTNQSPIFLRWALQQLAKWKNDTYPVDLIHIHGTKDRIFPHKLIQNPITIEGGTHFMNMEWAEEINRLIVAGIEGELERSF
ncbi:MAG: alpha/beta fold hydrolase [Chitinophagales bacterium]